MAEKKMPKVYFIGGKYMGCVYVRCLLPMYANGWKGNYLSLRVPMKDPSMVIKEVQSADVVVFHRPEDLHHHKMGQVLKQMGKKIVADNDDSFKFDAYHPFFQMDKQNFLKHVEYKNNLINNFLLNCDLATTSTEHLANEYREHQPNTIVLPNCVDPFDWETPVHNESEIVRIGLVGSVAYAHDFEVIKDVIKELHDMPNVQLILFGLHDIKNPPKADNEFEEEILEKEYGFWRGLPKIQQMSWVHMADYFKTLNDLRMDIMLIPRRENNFNKAKSNVKFLEAAMCEIPVVASKFSDGSSPYEGDINGDNGILVENDPAQWREVILSLIADKKKRRQIGKNAREYTLTNYNINDHAYKWAEAYQKLIT